MISPIIIGRTKAISVSSLIFTIYLLFFLLFGRALAFSQSGNDEALIKRHIRRTFNERVLREEVPDIFFVSMCTPFWHFVKIEGKQACRVGRVFDEYTGEYVGALAKKLADEEVAKGVAPLCEGEYSLQELINYMNALVFTERDFCSALAKNGEELDEDIVLDESVAAEGVTEGEDLLALGVVEGESGDKNVDLGAKGVNIGNNIDDSDKKKDALGAKWFDWGGESLSGKISGKWSEYAFLGAKSDNDISKNSTALAKSGKVGGNINAKTKAPKKSDGKNIAEKNKEKTRGAAISENGAMGKGISASGDKAIGANGALDVASDTSGSMGDKIKGASGVSGNANNGGKVASGGSGNNKDIDGVGGASDNAGGSGKIANAASDIAEDGSEGTSGASGDRGNAGEIANEKNSAKVAASGNSDNAEGKSEGASGASDNAGNSGNANDGGKVANVASDTANGKAGDGATGESDKESEEDDSKGEIFRTKEKQTGRVSVKGYGNNFERSYFDEKMRLVKKEYWEVQGVDKSHVTKSESFAYFEAGTLSSSVVRTDDERTFLTYDNLGRLTQMRVYKKIELDKEKVDAEIGKKEALEGKNGTSASGDNVSKNSDIEQANGDAQSDDSGKTSNNAQGNDNVKKGDENSGDVGANSGKGRDGGGDSNSVKREGKAGDDETGKSDSKGGADTVIIIGGKIEKNMAENTSDNTAKENPNIDGGEVDGKSDKKASEVSSDKKSDGKSSSNSSDEEKSDKIIKFVLDKRVRLEYLSTGTTESGESAKDSKVRSKEVTQYIYEEGTTKIRSKHTTREEFQYKIEKGNPDRLYYEDGRLCIKTIYSEKTSYIETKYFEGGFTVESHFLKGTHTKDVYYLNGSLWKEKQFSSDTEKTSEKNEPEKSDVAKASDE